MSRFVLEIGTEEIPARFLAGEVGAIVELLSAALAEECLEHGGIFANATPRRLCAVIENLAQMQPVREEIITGPPVAAAYDRDGAPTRALTGFVSGHDAALEDVFRKTTEKGEYVALRKKVGGMSAADILARICPDVISRLPFPKRMKWGSHSTLHARPLRWILALLDDRIIEFEAGPIRSGRESWGHRVMGRGPFSIPDASSYEELLSRQGAVEIDSAKRKALIQKEGNELAKAAGGAVLWKNALLDEVVGLVEKPVPLLGAFDEAFLEVPREVLLTSMETHQKSFGLQDANGRLLPNFLTVLNLVPEDMSVVRRGWERVLKARLEDARFFWRTDLGDSLDNWLEKLDHVIFIGPVGTMGDKSRRLAELCMWLAGELGLGPQLREAAGRAGRLAKADLVSSMVGEFDTLQGIMGGIYAREFGEREEVSAAISEQYLPAGPDSPLPATPLGCILSIADRADTLAACFGLDRIPTGAADPNGLRRGCLGIIRILLDRQWNLDVGILFGKARELYGERKWKLSPEAALEKLLEFFKGRLRNYFLNCGYAITLVDAALGGSFNNPVDVKKRLDALAGFEKQPVFLQSAQLLKRIDNILRKEPSSMEDWDSGSLAEPAEKALDKKLRDILPELDAVLKAGEYEKALSFLVVIEPAISEFFDNVMVLCEDEKLRKNRLGMLKSISSRYAQIANFANLQV